MKPLFFLACIALGVSACELKSKDGYATDTIKFSKRKLSFNTQGGVDTITSESTFWWIPNGMRIDNTSYEFAYENDTSEFPCCFKKDGEFVAVVECGIEGCFTIKKIEGTWFTIDKVTKKTLVFTVTPNETATPRNLILPIEAGNYATHITVAQAAE